MSTTSSSTEVKEESGLGTERRTTESIASTSKQPIKPKHQRRRASHPEVVPKKVVEPTHSTSARSISTTSETSQEQNKPSLTSKPIHAEGVEIERYPQFIPNWEEEVTSTPSVHSETKVGDQSAAASTTESTTRPADTEQMQDHYDIIIVGGGLSGLTAAYKLTIMTDIGVTPRILLLESSDRLGGRLESTLIPNTQERLDLGAMWIPGEHQTFWKLAAELGMEYYPNIQMGNNIYQHGNTVKMFHGPLSETFHAFGKMNTNSLYSRINKMSQKLAEYDPFLEEHSAHLDQLSVHAWAKKEAWSRDTIEALDLAVESIFGCKSTDISMLYFLYNIRTCGVELSRLCQIAVGYQCYRLSDGIQALTDRLAERIAAAGVKTLLNAEVSSIAQRNDVNIAATNEFTSVTVSTTQGTFYGKHLIFAASPLITTKIEFSPPLLPMRQQLPQLLHTNRWIKAFAVYDAPFWRESGYSGQVFIYSSLIEKEPISFVYEASTMTGMKNGTFVLCVSVVGERAAYWGGKTPDERRVAILRKLDDLFGPKALKPSYFVDHDWGKDRYARGGSFVVFPPGAMTGCFSGMREPHYRIHWASTETANEWQGYIEGACQSGLRAAVEVADRLVHESVVETAPTLGTVSKPTEATPTSSVATIGQVKPSRHYSNVPVAAPNVTVTNPR